MSARACKAGPLRPASSAHNTPASRSWPTSWRRARRGLFGCLLIMTACHAAGQEPQDRRQDYVLGSQWATVQVQIERSFVGDRFEEAAADGDLGQINFRLDTDTGAPGAAPPDANPAVVVVQLEMNSPRWIDRQLDPAYPNHFHLYEPTGRLRYGLEYRPSGQIESDGGFLMVGRGRARPLMIECFLRPARLPTRCQLWERREHGFTLSFHFNGARLPEWESLLTRVDGFVAPRVRVQPKQGNAQ